MDGPNQNPNQPSTAQTKRTRGHGRIRIHGNGHGYCKAFAIRAMRVDSLRPFHTSHFSKVPCRNSILISNLESPFTGDAFVFLHSFIRIERHTYDRLQH